MELWQMAAQWLYQAKALPSESPALGANAQLYDLAIALQVIVCYLSSFFQGWHCLVYRCKQTQSPMCENLSSETREAGLHLEIFLSNAVVFEDSEYKLLFGCLHKHIRAKAPADLFAAEELYYASNFGQVTNVLHILLAPYIETDR